MTTETIIGLIAAGIAAAALILFALALCKAASRPIPPFCPRRDSAEPLVVGTNATNENANDGGDNQINKQTNICQS